MSNSAGVIALSYDGNDVQQSDFSLFLEIVRGLNEAPLVRGRDTVVPSLAYRIPRSRVADSIVIELRGFITGTGSGEAALREDFRNNVDTIKFLFDPTGDPKDLVATCEDGTLRTISCRTTSLVWGQVLPSFANVSIELEAYEDWAVEAIGS